MNQPLFAASAAVFSPVFLPKTRTFSLKTHHPAAAANTPQMLFLC